MDILKFLQTIVPQQGYKCLTIISGPESRTQKFYQLHQDQAFDADNYDVGNNNVFYAPASYLVSGNRKTENVAAVKSFWVDLDVGKDKPYKTQKEALQDMFRFCQDSGLPVPFLVSSGVGFHAYWILTEEISRELWQDTARKFKAVARYLKLQAGPERTADIASILRPVGTHHRKAEPKLVKAINDPVFISFSEFAKILDELVAENNIEVISPSTTFKNESHIDPLHEALFNKPTMDPSSAITIAQECAQIRLMRDTKGVIPEPQWYHSIGVLRHCIEAPQIIHDWSCGHSGYTHRATEAKIAQHSHAASGATTCSTFLQINPDGCTNCPHRNKINSPITLGTIVPPAPVQTPPTQTLAAADQSLLGASPNPANNETLTPVEVHLDPPSHGVNAPQPFIRTAAGLIWKPPKKEKKQDGEENSEESTEIEFVYKHDIYVDGVYADEFIEGETFRVVHHLPNNGWQSFTMPTTVLAKIDTLYKELFKNHIKLEPAQVIPMAKYFIRYLQELQEKAKIRKLSVSMGWKESNSSFILGKKLFEPGKPVTDAGLSSGITDSFCEHFDGKGDMQKWIELTKILDTPGLEPHAFVLLLGFGAPLMPYTGYPGGLVSTVGKTNSGKTTMTKWMTSIYGYFNELKAQKGDTTNSMFQRLGVFANLPFTIDEITNVNGMELSDFVYTITQGRVKTRLRQDASERKNNLRWNTIVVASSNERLIDKLAAAKAQPEAEQMRVLEYEIAPHPVFEKSATEINETLESNYGTVGPLYIQYLVDHANQLGKSLSDLRECLMTMSDARPSERYWYAILASALLGGKIAQSLGLIHFNLERVTQVMLKLVTQQREYIQDNQLDYVVLLGIYLNEHISNRLVVRKFGTGANETTHVQHFPHNHLCIRVEIMDDKVYTFIDKTHMAKWLIEHHVDVMSMSKYLQDKKILIASNGRKALNAGWTENPGSARVRVWQIDAEHPDLGQTALRLVHENTEMMGEIRK